MQLKVLVAPSWTTTGCGSSSGCCCNLYEITSAAARYPTACCSLPIAVVMCWVFGVSTVFAARHLRTCGLNMGLICVPSSFLLSAVILPMRMSGYVQSAHIQWLMRLTNVSRCAIALAL